MKESLTKGLLEMTAKPVHADVHSPPPGTRQGSAAGTIPLSLCGVSSSPPSRKFPHFHPKGTDTLEFLIQQEQVNCSEKGVVALFETPHGAALAQELS